MDPHNDRSGRICIRCLTPFAKQQYFCFQQAKPPAATSSMEKANARAGADKPKRRVTNVRSKRMGSQRSAGFEGDYPGDSLATSNAPLLH
jgi:hypothetical protein